MKLGKHGSNVEEFITKVVKPKSSYRKRRDEREDEEIEFSSNEKTKKTQSSRRGRIQ